MDTGIQDMDDLTPADLADECDHEDCALFLRSPSQVYYLYVGIHLSITIYTDKKSTVECYGLSDIKQ